MARKTRKVAGLAAGVAALGTAALLAVPGVAGASAARPPVAPCGGQTKACVDLSANTAWLMNGRGGTTYGGVAVSHGMPGYQTPPGTYRVTWKDIDHWSEDFNGPMPYSVFFTDSGIAFHEGDIGAQSHGCVRLQHKDAVSFFNTLAPGDIVKVLA
jgi:L,D-transpeptidase catalytic domain